MFFWLFSLFVGLITYFDYLLTWVLLFIFAGVALLLIILGQYCGYFFKSIGWAILLSCVSVGLYSIRIDTNSFVGSYIDGVIVDIRKPETYILHNNQGDWLLRSDKILNPGDRVGVRGKVTYAEGGLGNNGKIVSLLDFDYPKWLYMKGYIGDISSYNIAILGSSTVGLLQTQKDRLRQYILSSKLSHNSKALLLGVFIGDRSLLPASDYAQFIESGLVHIIAVSGSNMLYIILFGSILFFWLPVYRRYSLLVILMVLYTSLCGWDSSIVRAFVMGSLVMITLLLGRPIKIFTLISIAWVGMLLWNPYYLLYDLGFILSFSALLGILIVDKIVSQYISTYSYLTKKILKEYILPTFGAGIAVLPVVLLFSGTYNILSLAANLLVVPIVPLLFYGGIGLFALGGSILGGVLANGIDFLVSWIRTINSMTVIYGPQLSLDSSFAKVVVFTFFLVVYTSCIIWSEKKYL